MVTAVTDSEAREVVQTETRQGTVWLSRARQAFLRRASAAGRRPVLVSDGLSELTEPMRQALRFHDGGWAVRGGDGVLRNGLTGRRMTRVADALNLEPVEDPSDLALSYLRPARSGHAQLMVSVSVRHPSGPVPLPGEPAEVLLTSLTGEAPAAFGRFEPTLTPWDAAEIGWLCDRDGERHVASSVFMVSGAARAPASLVMALQQTLGHTEERLAGLIDLGPLEDPCLSGRLGRVDQALAALSRSCDVMFALISTRPGNRRLTQAPVMPNAPVPLAVLLGDALIKGLRVDVRATLERFRGATRCRGSGLMIPLETRAASGVRLPQLVQAVGLGRATPRMGVSQSQLEAVEYAARY
jgi:hypothetical protein